MLHRVALGPRRAEARAARAIHARPDRGADPPRRPHDGSRTRVEARVAFPSLEEEDEVATSTRRFSVMETTSGLPDDFREEDERAAERHLRDLRGRVKSARAVVAGTPGLTEALAKDWRKAARFYARFGITEEMFRQEVSSNQSTLAGGFFEQSGHAIPQGPRSPRTGRTQDRGPPPQDR